MHSSGMRTVRSSSRPGGSPPGYPPGADPPGPGTPNPREQNDGQTCKNITLSQTSLAGGNNLNGIFINCLSQCK